MYLISVLLAPRSPYFTLCMNAYILLFIHSFILIQAARPIKHTDNRQTDKQRIAITQENIYKPNKI